MPLTRALEVISRALPPSESTLDQGHPLPRKVVLPAVRDTAAGAETAAPVRIFVGTEPGQYRAERVFVWSIECVRDRSRTYEIYLMKSLDGFDRRGWLTGFTNYRFAIPHLCEARGRAIYNDVDQIYLSDPALLFDLDMQGHGFLSINDRDTSVMLIDCARMATVWPIETVQRRLRKALEAAARRTPDCWGRLDGGWNARDTEYEEGRSHLIHFTTIHTQPWRPFPEQYVYQHNAVGSVWDDLERGADEAGFAVYDCDAQPEGFASRVHRIAGPGAAGTESHEPLGDLIAKSGAATALVVSVGGCGPSRDLLNGSVHYEYWDPCESDGGPRARSYDVVACYGSELLDDEDLAWFFADLAGRARIEFYAGVTASRERIAGDARGHARWVRLLEDVARPHETLHWTLAHRDGSDRLRLIDGGRRDGNEPTVWVLTNHKPGHTTQSVGLAQALGVEYELKSVRFSWTSLLADRLLGNPRIDPLGNRSKQLVPPWPDLVIATGWHTVPVARWIRERSGWRTRIVQLGRKGGNVADAFDAVVTCKHFRLPPHPRRIETAAPLSQVTAARLHESAQRWPDLMRSGARPHVVALVGGDTHQHRLSRETAAELGKTLARFTKNCGGSLAIVNSRRTGDEATDAIEREAGPAAHVHRWHADPVENPYLGYLAAADVLVVTGDSESMIAEAAAAGKPLYIAALPSCRRSPIEWIAERITRKAYSRPKKKRKGTVHPQRGLVYLCARLIDRGWVNPPRDLDKFYEGLYELDIARPFTPTPDLDWIARGASDGLHEADRAALEIRRLLGWPRSDRGSESAMESHGTRAAGTS